MKLLSFFLGIWLLGWTGTANAEILINQDDFNAWTVRDNTRWTVSDWPDGQGGCCGKLVFERYGSGERWPAIVFTGNRHDDWRNVERVIFRFYAEKANPIYLQLRDGEFWGQYDVSLQPGYQEVVLDSEFLRRKNLRHVNEIHIFSCEPSEDITVWVGPVKLETADRLSAPLADLTGRLAAAAPTDRDDRPALLQKAMEQNYQAAQQRLAALNQLPATERLSPPAGSFDRLEEARELVQTLNDQRALDAFHDRQPEEICVASFADATEKVHRDGPTFHGTLTEAGRISAARGEAEGLQVILLPRQALHRVSIRTAGPLKTSDGTELPAAAVAIAPIGYVNCALPPYEVSRTGWWPDPLLEQVAELDLEPFKFQSFYVDVTIPADQPAGLYRGKLQLSAEGMPERELALTVEVYDFTLPPGSPYPIATQLSMGPVENNFADPAARDAYRRQCQLLALTHRVNPDTIYEGPRPAEDVKFRLDHGAGRFNLTYVQPWRNDADLNHYPAWARNRIMDEQLKTFVPQYEAAGVLDRGYIYSFDEISEEFYAAAREILSEIKRTYPNIPQMTTARDYSFGLDSNLDDCIDIWVPDVPAYEAHPTEIAAARARGKQVWWYIYASPYKPYNFFIENPGLAQRLLMGVQAWKYQTDGFLYYYLLWSKEAFLDGAPLTNWAPATYFNTNGDGNLMYTAAAGPVPSLRLKLIRDGIEDYWYFRLLAEAVDAVKQGAPAPDAAWLENAEALLKVPETLARSLDEHTVDPQELQAARETIARLLTACHAGGGH